LALLLAAVLLASCGGSPDQLSGSTIREKSQSAVRDRLVQVALTEWDRWGRQRGYPKFRRGHREHEAGYSDRVRQYWREGLGRTVNNVTRVGWSGAFISWAFKQAGAGRKFPYSGTHVTYIRNAIRNRKSALKNAFLLGFRPGEHTLRPGDMVCNALSNGVSYDDLPRDFGAHCDIVVSVRRWEVEVIGGNLTNSVSRRTLVADGQGRIFPTQPRGVDPAVKSWFVVIRVDR